MGKDIMGLHYQSKNIMWTKVGPIPIGWSVSDLGQLAACRYVMSSRHATNHSAQCQVLR